jgi:vancomycin resistance protein YoaR
MNKNNGDTTLHNETDLNAGNKPGAEQIGLEELSADFIDPETVDAETAAALVEAENTEQEESVDSEAMSEEGTSADESAPEKEEATDGEDKSEDTSDAPSVENADAESEQQEESTSHKSRISGVFAKARTRVHIPEKHRKIFLIAAVAVLALAIIGVGAFFVNNGEKTYKITDANGKVKMLTISEMESKLNIDTFYTGVTINGIDVSGKTKEEAVALFEDDTTQEIKIMLSVDGEEYPLEAALVETSSDVSSVIDTAFNYNRAITPTDSTDDIISRYKTLVQLQKTTKNFTITKSTDTEVIEEAVHNILDPLEIEAVGSTATAFDTEKLVFIMDDATPGLDLDIEAAIEDVLAAIEAKEFTKTIVVDTSVVDPVFSTGDEDVTLGLVSTFTTKTSNIPNRNTNINLVCETIDGLVLQPGEYFSFNEFVGMRTAAKGYKTATGIFNGTTRQELGGGICQTTGTLFHSVLMADLQVDERKPHSWPSDYVDIGTDATVTWGGANFQFTNNTDYPIAIHAFYEDLHVTMQIYGRPVEDGMTIDVIGVVTGRTSPGATEYVANPNAAVGSKDTVRSAHDQITANCYQVFYNKDGEEVKRVLAFKSSYRGITAQISVGVKGPDGTIYSMDPATGVVSGAPVVTGGPSPTTEPTIVPTLPPEPTIVPTTPPVPT